MAGVLDVTRWEVRPWDSGFFGRRLAQVTGHQATAPDLEAAIEQARAASVECLYFLADAADRDTVRAAEATGFSLVDVRLTLERIVANGGAASTPDAAIRPARLEDLPLLSALARTSHRNTRFHIDPHFDPQRSDEMYVVWIERSVRGELADAVFVADADGAARGYITVSGGDAASSIGLVAVEAAYRGRGLGDRLLRAAVQWTAARGLGRVSVVTQGRSAPSIRFYERAGFTTSLVQFWYHRWLVVGG